MTKDEAIKFKQLYDISKQLADNLEEAYILKCDNCTTKKCKTCVCKKWFISLKKLSEL